MKYSKPTVIVENLKLNCLLNTNSKVHDLTVGDSGRFDTKACYFDADEEDLEN